jgi:hypothetical protein
LGALVAYLKLIVFNVSLPEPTYALIYLLLVGLDLLLADLPSDKGVLVNAPKIVCIFGHPVAEVGLVVGVLETLGLIDGHVDVGFVLGCNEIPLSSFEMNVGNFVPLNDLTFGVNFSFLLFPVELLVMSSDKSLLRFFLTKLNI